MSSGVDERMNRQDQNGDAVPGPKPKKSDDKEHLINDREPPPKYDSSGPGAEAEESSDAKEEEAGPRVSTLQLVIGGLIVALATFGQVFLFVYTAERQVIRMRLAFYRNIMRQEMAWFDANSCGEMTVKLTDDISRIHDAIGDKLGTAVQYLTASIFGFVIIFYYGWELALVMQIGAPFLILAFALMGVVFTNMSALERQAYAKAGGVAEEVFSSIRTVHAFNGQEKECKRYLETLKEAKEYGIKKSLASGLGQGASWGICIATLALGFWYGGKLIRDGDYEVHEMMAVFMVALVGCQCLGLSLPFVMTVNNGRGAAHGVYTIIDRLSAIDSASDEGLRPDTLTGNIALKGVHFTYPTRADVKILKGLDMTVSAGQTVALVGQSGCGKSTVIQLLQRFYDPDAGQVCLDGVDLRDINIRWLRQNVGIVGNKDGDMKNDAQKKTKEIENTEGGKDRRKSSAKLLHIDKMTPAPNTFLRIVKLNKPEWIFVFFGSIGGFCNGAMQPAWALVLAEAIEVYSHESKSYQKDKMNDLCLLSVAIGFTMFVSFTFQEYMFGISGESLTMRIRGMLFKAMARQNIGWFDEPEHETGTLSSHLAMEASLVQGAVKTSFAYTLVVMGNLGVGLIVSFIYSWQMALILLLFVPIIVVGYVLITKLLSGADNEGMEILEELSQDAMESIDNIRTVAALTKEQTIYDIFYDKLWSPFKKHMRSKIWMSLVASFTQGLSQWTFGLSFYVGSRLLKSDDVSYGDIFRVMGCLIFSTTQLGRSVAFAPDFSKARNAAAYIFHLHDKTPPIDAYSKEGNKPAPGTFKATVRFEGIHFRYPMRPDVKILNGLDLSVEPGQTLALVGESGCGKSTTVQLVERFYDPEGGQVRFDKYRLKDLNIEWLRAQIGLVSQEPILFDQSIAENIAYGDNSRTVSMDEIIQAAKSANIHNFVQSLPAGYDTNVGSKGTQLSGGQKQRVAIARALIRNPKILLLDEATSALDTESEKVVQEALDKARAGRTCITIAHRLTTIKDADKIAVFKGGVVHEIGTHDTLMAKQGLYFKLQRAQH
ncbi:multidrug resistance protein 1 [Elysia marginata]|uniref:Multidrug resistance protein 1 n=1 Tax=Elysia marginata TaxID=1093978 RepID=A0AAV4ECV7_9GAST|nr:multidrug resistance protein 1 [Elysia marginata]